MAYHKEAVEVQHYGDQSITTTKMGSKVQTIAYADDLIIYGALMLPVEYSAKLSRAKLYRKIRGNTQHPLHATINMRQRNGWTPRYRNVTESHQDNWKKQPNYKDKYLTITTPLQHGGKVWINVDPILCTLGV